MARYSKKAGEKVEEVMHEQKKGKLKSGSGRKVTDRKQAIAIALSEARKEGAKVPSKGAARKDAPKKAAKKSAQRKTAAKKGPAKKGAVKKGAPKKGAAKKAAPKKAPKKGAKKTARKS